MEATPVSVVDVGTLGFLSFFFPLGLMTKLANQEKKGISRSPARTSEAIVCLQSYEQRVKTRRRQISRQALLRDLPTQAGVKI